MRLGCLPDPPKLAGETPDWKFDRARLTATSPPSHSLRELVLDVLDQGQLGSCVANATLQAVRMRHVAQGVANPRLGSRLMSYYLARCADGAQVYDAGTYNRRLFEMLNKFGFCAEEIWPYSDLDTGMPTDPYRLMPSTKAFHDAFDQRSPTIYRRIDSVDDQLIEDLKLAISNGFPVPFGCDVNVAFTTGNFNPKQALPAPTISAGGHAMIYVGYSGDVFEVLNSWSADFGDNGFIYFTPEYVMTTRDQWQVEHSPVDGEI